MTDFDVDDLVWIGDREDKELAVVVLPAHRAPDTAPDDAPDLNGLCCVPIALVRIVSDGWMRWVKAGEMTAAEHPRDEDEAGPRIRETDD